MRAGSFPAAATPARGVSVHADGSRPRHVLMTTDAVGGVWRYCVDLAGPLNAKAVSVLLVCLGPRPSARLVHLDEPLDWMACERRALRKIPDRLTELAERHDVDLVHLNLPSQASGMRTDLPVVVVSHSCVVTWWQAVRGTPLPTDWAWQVAMNREGLERADLVLAPTSSHAEALGTAYGAFGDVRIVPNAVSDDAATGSPDRPRENVVLAAARWWDEGKNAALLDRVAGQIGWPVRAAGACRGDNGQSFAFTHVEGLGERPHAELRALMRRAALFVSPSLYEPFGLAALEAAQAGAALVMADIPTYREIWEGAAMFADLGDADAFAKAIDGLIRDPSRRLGLAAAAGERARRYTADAQIDALLAAYRSAAIGHSALRQELAS